MMAIIAILIVLPIALIGFLYKRHRKLKAYYEVICKKSSSIKPYDVLGLRGLSIHGFNDYYYQRKDEDKLIKKKIENGKNVLILGNPLAGKSRTIYQALISLKKPHNVIIPAVVDIIPKDLLFPIPISFWRKSILVLDDLVNFTEKQNFMYLLHEFLIRNTLIIASCRSGPEYYILYKKLEIELSNIFDFIIEIPKISMQEGEKVAEKAGKSLPPAFDGNIGSIFLPLDTIRDRFQDCSEVNKCILRAIKSLYYAGIYREREIFSIERIKRVCEKKEMEMKSYEWNETLNELKNKGLIEKIEKDEVWAEETYLRYVIKDDFSPLDNLDEMITIFSNDAEALINIGNRSYNIGLIDIQKAEYMRIAIKAYEESLKVYTPERFPMQYAMTQNNLGNAYSKLAEVKDKAENCKRAIEAYEEALKVRTLECFSIDYAMTQNNLGSVFRTLAEVEDNAGNCKRAIIAFEEALKVRTLERFPMQYATTQNNLGNAYSTLAEAEDKAENCNRAIIAFEEALKFRTPERYQIDYAMTKNNLGSIYTTLAKVENKAENCKRAIRNLKEALKVRTLEQLPMQYAMTQNNLGNAYRMLADVENKTENCSRAIQAYEEALKVRTLERFPMDFAMTQNNLGAAYGTLAEVENKANNSNRAIEAYKEALKVYTLERFPMDYAMTQNNLGAAYRTLAEVEDKAENCNRAIKALTEAIKIRTLEIFPMQYAMTQSNLGDAYRTLAEVEDQAENCKQAIKAYKEVLKVYTLKCFPMQYELIQKKLRAAYNILVEGQKNE